MTNAIVIVFIFCFLLCLIIALGFIKANKHFEYLKIVNPEKFGKYPDFYSVFTLKYLNPELQFLVLPFFNRKIELENSTSSKLATSIRKLLYLHIASFIILILYVLVLMY
jgi:hypothetical protein